MSSSFRYCPYCEKESQCEIHFAYEKRKCIYEYECIECGNILETIVKDKI